MDSSLSSNGSEVSVNRKYSTSNTFFWYFFQTLTVSFMLLMVLSIYYAFSPGNIRGVCVTTVAFCIITPTVIIPKLSIIASVAIPIFELNKNVYINVLNILVWITGGYVYPFPAHLLCFSLMAGVGLFKLYGDIGGSSSPRIMSLFGGTSSPRFVSVIGMDALRISGCVFNHEIKYGTGRWVDSSTGCALLGLFFVTMLAHVSDDHIFLFIFHLTVFGRFSQYVPPLVEPAEKKKMMMMMNEIEAISIEVGSDEKEKKNKVNVVAEAPIPGSGGTKSFWKEETV